MDILRNNEQVMCPYDPTHYIQKSKMDVHLMRCSAKYRGTRKIVICDFNTSHRMPAHELQRHLDTCPSRKVFELYGFNKEKFDTQSAAKEGDFQTAEKRRFNSFDISKNDVSTATSSQNVQAEKVANGTKDEEKWAPIPAFTGRGIEKPHEIVSKTMAKLSIIPKAAVIPKQKNALLTKFSFSQKLYNCYC